MQTATQTKKHSDRIRDGKQITLRFPPSIEREVHAMAEEEGLLTTAWIRRLVVLELRRMRRGKAGI